MARPITFKASPHLGISARPNPKRNSYYEDLAKKQTGVKPVKKPRDIPQQEAQRRMIDQTRRLEDY